MTPPVARRGFSLAELLVALTLLAVVLGAVLSLAVAQQRAYSALASRAAARVQLRDAALLLAHDLRPLAGPAGVDPGDIREATDTLLDVLATTGGSVACAFPTSATIELPPSEPPESALTWWVAPPRPGDIALLLDPGASPGEEDDRWLARSVASASASAAACAGSPLAGDRPGGYRITLAGASLPPTAAAGVPIAFARRRRWSHYRASDALWYLGLREWDGTSWSETQPAAGPFRRAGLSAPGMSVLAVDSSGTPVAGDSPELAGVRIAFRADPAVSWTTRRWPVVPESVRALLAPRGRRWGTP
jgi:prepilin-type N-terminal cleavage/methylation domain-containing protein